MKSVVHRTGNNIIQKVSVQPKGAVLGLGIPQLHDYIKGNFIHPEEINNIPEYSTMH